MTLEILWFILHAVKVLLFMHQIIRQQVFTAVQRLIGRKCFQVWMVKSFFFFFLSNFGLHCYSQANTLLAVATHCIQGVLGLCAAFIVFFFFNSTCQQKKKKKITKCVAPKLCTLGQPDSKLAHHTASAQQWSVLMGVHGLGHFYMVWMNSVWTADGCTTCLHFPSNCWKNSSF